MPFIDYLRFPVFPQLQELLAVPLFLSGGDTATHLLPLFETLVTAALLLEWGRRYGAPAGPLAAALFLGGPIVIQLATIGYTDAAVTLFVTAAFYALDRARDGGWRWAALSGALAGAACCVKYNGGYAAAAGLIAVLAWRDRRRVVAFVAAAAAAALPAYARILYWTGNPVFPFFGDSAWSMPLPALTPSERLVRAVRVAWDVTFARDRINQQPPFTPFFLAMLLAIAAAAVRSARARAVLLLTAVYLAIFTFLPQDSRYLVPLLPLLSIAAAAAIAPHLAARRRAIAVALTLLALSPGAAYIAYRLVRAGAPPVTPAARRAFLEARIPELRALAHAGPGLVYVCRLEQLQYFRDDDSLRGDYTGPFAYSRVRLDSGDAAARGIRWVLVSKKLCGDIAVTNASLVYEDGTARLWRVR
jgi:4-amino-4-deoxy-L-arabinose transferase-like glycosyltransferase